MAEKKTLTGRVEPGTAERFEEYRETYNLNKSEAVRRLVDAGLEAEESTGEENAEIGLRTQSEKWFRRQFEKSAIGVFLSAVAFAGFFLALLVAQMWLGVAIPESLPTQVLSIFMLIGLAAFVISLGVGIITGAALKLGIARRLDQQIEAEEKEATV